MAASLFSRLVEVLKEPIASFLQCHINRSEFKLRQVTSQFGVIGCFLVLAICFVRIEVESVLQITTF